MDPGFGDHYFFVRTVHVYDAALSLLQWCCVAWKVKRPHPRHLFISYFLAPPFSSRNVQYTERDVRDIPIIPKVFIRVVLSFVDIPLRLQITGLQSMLEHASCDVWHPSRLIHSIEMSTTSTFTTLFRQWQHLDADDQEVLLLSRGVCGLGISIMTGSWDFKQKLKILLIFFGKLAYWQLFLHRKSMLS